jgi:hypothetical protein
MDQIGGSDLFTDLKVDAKSASLLKSAAKWGKISAIISLVNCFITLSALVFAAVKGSGGDLSLIGFELGTLIIFILPFLTVLVVLSIFLLRFAASTTASLETLKQDVFNQAVNFLKNYFKTLGVAIIVGICIAIVAFIAFGIGASIN